VALISCPSLTGLSNALTEEPRKGRFQEGKKENIKER
jgi:hypothetical protein